MISDASRVSAHSSDGTLTEAEIYNTLWAELMTLEPEQPGAQKFLSSAEKEVLSLSFEGEDRQTSAVEITRLWQYIENCNKKAISVLLGIQKAVSSVQMRFLALGR